MHSINHTPDPAKWYVSVPKVLIVVEKYLPLFAGIDIMANMLSTEVGVTPLTKAAHPAFEEVENFRSPLLTFHHFLIVK